MARGFGGVPGGGNMQGMLKQAQQMQEKLMKAQEESEALTAEESAGGGMVKIKVNGKNQIEEIFIDPQVIDPKDPEMLQDLIKVAANAALTKVQADMKEKMSKIAGGLSIPGLF